MLPLAPPAPPPVRGRAPAAHAAGHRRGRRGQGATWLALLLALGACATRPPSGDAEAQAEFRQNNDPFEPANRASYSVNTTLDTAILKPASQAYAYVVPEPVRGGVHNVLSNITDPVLFANDVLQGKPRRAGDSFMRFLLNSSVGVLGIFDVASSLGYPPHDAGFGTTLALWGVPSGPFLFLPVLGPSSPRDAVGFAGDTVLDPFTYASFGGSKTLGWSRYGVGVVDTRQRVGPELDTIEKTALDPYATFRSLYQQHRMSEVDAARQDERPTVPDWFPGHPNGPTATPAPAQELPKPNTPAQIGRTPGPGVN